MAKDRNNNGIPDSEEVVYKISILVRCAVLVWSAGMLTATYVLKTNFDATFIASVFSGTLATFGVDLGKRGDKDKSNPEIVSPPASSLPSEVAKTTQQTAPSPRGRKTP